MTFETEGFEELAEQLRDEADRFDVSDRAIEEGIDDVMEQHIIPEARKRAKKYVQDGPALSINHAKGHWVGDTYQHEYFARHPMVSWHEFGTGGRASDGTRGTVNGTTYRGQPGYIIRPRGDWPLGIPARRWTGPSYMVDSGTGKVHFDYVVHPGVHGKHFMENTLRDSSKQIQGYVGQAVQRDMSRDT